jgi:adenosylcobinamide-phosphate synthase
MAFLSIICALLLDQFKPLDPHNKANTMVRALATRIEGWCNAGHAHHGRVGWILVISILVVPTIIIYAVCLRISPIAALAWNALVVYLTLGFRRYSMQFNAIQLALLVGDDVRARALLAEWIGQEATGLDAPEIARIATEKALLACHRRAFGIFFWFLMPLGPAGAILYRVSEYLAWAWNEPEPMRSEPFGRFAARIFYLIDWIPARLTAIAFAVVGNFEDAIYAWRNFSERWTNANIGVILAAGGGAMGVQLGSPAEKAARIMPLDETVLDAPEPEAPPGDEPSARSLQTANGLMWRALLLWLLMLLLFSLAVWLG